VIKDAAITSYRTVRKRRTSLKMSPENEELYRPISKDPDIAKLAESIRSNGLHEPLIVTEDNYIVSGHRRFVALCLNKQKVVPCRVVPIRWADTPHGEFVCILRDHNRQRQKTIAEQVREELVDVDPDTAYAEMQEGRQIAANGASYYGIETIVIEGAKRRFGISDQKADHVAYIKKVVFEDRKDYWPLSVRGVHYALLNYTFYRNIPRQLRYVNDDKSYQATSELITRMRLNGAIPWEALTDGTRPFTEFRPFDNVREFITQATDGFLRGYWRNLLQTQRCHIEVLCEKNTIYHMVCRVAEQYQIPTSSGRGFNSIDPWHELVARFRHSGKDRLAVIVLSDYDPEGEQIPQVGGRTLRDDFGLEPCDFDIIKAGVTRDQIEEHNLPEQNFAKETSSNYDWFVERNDGDDSVYELEALDPADMLASLKEVIEMVLDVPAFNAEVEREREESIYLHEARQLAMKALGSVLEDGAQ
jgi:hypothetical protein